MRTKSKNNLLILKVMITSQIEFITPQLAEKYLATSNGNRPISHQIVDSYAESMKRGEWMLNGVPIVFGACGNLLDGHHRLFAIVASQVSIRTLVVRGVQNESFTTFDCGRHRTFGQILAMQGVENYKKISAIVSGVDAMRSNGRIYESNNRIRLKKTNTDALNEYNSNPSMYNHAARFASSIHNRLAVIKESWIGSMWYLLTQDMGYDRYKVEYFFENLCSAKQSECQVIELLRVKLIKESASAMKYTTQMKFQLIAKAFNLYINNESVGVLKITEKDKKYTQFIHA